jgi:hypothetical protein
MRDVVDARKLDADEDRARNWRSGFHDALPDFYDVRYGGDRRCRVRTIPDTPP